jgi:hypothetical protein
MKKNQSNFNTNKRLSTALEEDISDDTNTINNSPSHMKYGNSTKKAESNASCGQELMKIPSHNLINRKRIGLDLGNCVIKSAAVTHRTP